ncbi:type II toxin-antitoxin system death-on-curing family toxin [Geminocystis sp. CENA526]|uniref:type II toxin-antitoxin system death-on-curing family toxin n=1 Tax=Geminocystis TaxID=669357 RepID=UPI00034C42E8|nr:type II toxin-antitoxin system death-on-curing family toxin [Geminocystis herdmanii]
MDNYIWISEDIAILIHDDLIREYGGSFGIRDAGLLSSALARAKNIYLYEGKTLIFLAAAIAYGIVKNHPFIDGNKRTAFQVMFAFLKVNGKTLNVAESEVVFTMIDLAEGKIQEDDLVNWLEKYLCP